LCGVENAHIGTISTQWNEADQKPRIKAIKELLNSRGVSIEAPHLVLTVEGKPMFAYPDNICLAILEYYAFEAGSNSKDEARKNFRILAGSALQDFIYTQVGYSPVTQIPIVWQQFHDRVSLVYDSVPLGYFSVFKEIADVVVTLIRSGAAIGRGISLKEAAKKAQAAGLVYAKSGAKVPVSTVHMILRNRPYTGQFEWDGKLFQGTHEPLVPIALWERVQGVISL
jgi:Recombinase